MYVAVNFLFQLSNDPGKVDSNFFCYAATVLGTFPTEECSHFYTENA